MTIDGKELRGVLERAGRWIGQGGVTLTGADFALLHKAASAYAATLPREVEIVQWAVVSSGGMTLGTYPTKESADACARDYASRQVVRLTGTAVIKPEV